jgi:hypothetical protein
LPDLSHNQETKLNKEEMLGQPLTEAHIISMLMTLSAELAARYAERIEGLQSHIAAGAGIEFRIQLVPSQRLDLFLEDSNGKKLPLAYKIFDVAPRH